MCFFWVGVTTNSLFMTLTYESFDFPSTKVHEELSNSKISNSRLQQQTLCTNTQHSELLACFC